MTPTEKKYSNLIGNMYWEDVVRTSYDGVNDKWISEEGKQLIMITGVRKGNNWNQYANEYYYVAEILQRPFPTNNNSSQLSIRCKLLRDCVEADSTYHPVDTNEQATV